MEEIKNLIDNSKNICLIPSQNNEPESLTSVLALFYTLKELNKNVNLIIGDFPEKLDFLIPSPDFIASPKNLVISIPRNMADVSQIYYEKNEENLKIHLTVDKGRIKKEGVSFYFHEPKPDLVITVGIKDLHNQLSDRLDSFGFILDAPILNIDTSISNYSYNGENLRFGKINLVEQKSTSEIVLDMIQSIDQNLIKKNAANCILAGLVIFYENFRSPQITPKVFEIAADLVKRGANHQQIIGNLEKATEEEILFFSKIFQQLKNEKEELSVSILESDDFKNFSEQEATMAVEKIKTMGIQNNLLVLWQGHSSSPSIKGFFYSIKPNLLNRILENCRGVLKNSWVFLSIPGSDIKAEKNKIANLLL